MTRNSFSGAALLAAGLFLCAPLTGCAHYFIAPSDWTYEQRFSRGGRLDLVGRFAVVDVAGTPEEMGRQLGELVGPEAKELLAGLEELWPEVPTSDILRLAREKEPSIPDAYRRELKAFADASGADYERLVALNVFLSPLGTTVLASGDAAAKPHGKRHKKQQADGQEMAEAANQVAIARTVDHYEPRLLGPRTVITIFRPAGKRPFVSVGVPGLTSVLTGMNDAGLTAAVLHSWTGEQYKGAPVGFRARAILENAGTVEAGFKVFEKEHVGTADFIALADAQAGAVGYASGQDWYRVFEPELGLLAWSNGRLDPFVADQSDVLAQCVDDLAWSRHGKLDPTELRKIMTAAYIPTGNAQAMVFVPEKRALQLALGTNERPAALRRYHELSLGRALDGAGAASIGIEQVPLDEPLAHWTKAEYKGTRLRERRVKVYRAYLEDLQAAQSIAPFDRCARWRIIVGEIGGALFRHETFAQMSGRPLVRREALPERLVFNDLVLAYLEDLKLALPRYETDTIEQLTMNEYIAELKLYDDLLEGDGKRELDRLFAKVAPALMPAPKPEAPKAEEPAAPKAGDPAAPKAEEPAAPKAEESAAPKDDMMPPPAGPNDLAPSEEPAAPPGDGK